eukprot:550128-Amphidinium_carterae.1
MSSSPELSGKRKWISDQRADHPAGALVQDEHAAELQVVEMGDTPAFWPTRMKKAFMKNEVGEFRCKMCNVYTIDLQAFCDHYTSRHFKNDIHTSLCRGAVFNITTHVSSRELGMALEIIKKHGKRLNPRWGYEAYRADVMASRGGHHVDESRALSPHSDHQASGHYDEMIRVVHRSDRPSRATKRCARKHVLSESSYSDAHDATEIEIQELRSQLAKERRRNGELESRAERAEHHSNYVNHLGTDEGIQVTATNNIKFGCYFVACHARNLPSGSRGFVQTALIPTID